MKLLTVNAEGVAACGAAQGLRGNRAASRDVSAANRRGFLILPKSSEANENR